jgi:hypothetical protein
MAVNSAGTIQVYSGASVAGVILSSGAGLIYGSGAKITDAQYSSGAVLNCNVWGHDTETVFEGTHDIGSFTLSNGTASGLVLWSGNRLAASYYGQVSHVTAQSLGQFSLCFGAFAQDCIVSAGGTIIVSSGASANRLQNAGSLTGENDIALSNLTVSSPGFGNIVRGNAENVCIGSGAYCSFGSSCTIHSGSIDGTLYLNNSCAVNGLTLGVGGTVSCIQRGVFQNLTIERGGYCIPGAGCTFSNAVVYGSVYSANTCTANGLTVGSGGFVSCNLNGVFQNLTVESDGILSMASNGTVTNATIDGGLHALMGFKGTHIECLSGGVLSCGNGTGHTLTSISNQGLVQILSRGTITHMLNQGTLSVGGGINVLNGISNGGTMYLAGGNHVTFTGTMGGTVYESSAQSALVGMTLGSGGRYVWAGFSAITHITSVPPGAALEIRGSRNSALSVQLDDGAELCLYGASNHISGILCGTSATIDHSGSANSILNVTLGPGGSYLMNGPLACSAISGVIASGAVMECIGSQNVARYFTVAECGTLRLSGSYGRGTFIELKSGGLLEVGGSYTSALSVTVSSGGTLSYGGLGVFGSAINLLSGGHLSAQGSSVSLYVTSNDGAIVDVGDGVKIYYV